MAESFFQLHERERIRRRIYATLEEARSDMFDYIELFYNTRRRHGANDQYSQAEYEQQILKRLASIWKIRGDSHDIPEGRSGDVP